MPDSTRRDALGKRSKVLRERVIDFHDRLKDERAKEFVRRMVLSSLDDVDTFFLGDPSTRPSMDMWETMWLDHAENILASAEQNFGRFEEQVARFGGPENIALMG